MLFLRYVDYTVKTVKDNRVLVVDAANKLHPNFQFTIERDKNCTLALLDINVKVGSRN